MTTYNITDNSMIAIFSTFICQWLNDTVVNVYMNFIFNYQFVFSNYMYIINPNVKSKYLRKNDSNYFLKIQVYVMYFSNKL